MSSRAVIDIEAGIIHEVGTWSLDSDAEQKTGDVCLALEDDDQISINFDTVCLIVPAERSERS